MLIKKIIGILSALAFVLAAGLTTAEAAEIQWFGQSALKITTPGGKVIVIDPFITKNPKTPKDLKDLKKLGKVDLVISSLGKNPDREKVIDFSAPYAPFYNGVFGPADFSVEKADDLSGMSVGVTRGAIEDIELTKIAPADVDIKRYEDNNGTISAFLSGQVDLIATGNVTAAAIIERNPPRKPEPKFLIKNSPCYVGLNKDEPEFMAKVNEIIAASMADGRLNAIAEKWLGIPLPEKL